MATIIKHVDGYMHSDIQHGILCTCGTGNTRETTPRICRCGKMMHPHTFDFSRWVKGYVVVKCNCDREVECHNFTNTCDGCGCDYNFAGDELAPREFWGEETGELPSECS